MDQVPTYRDLHAIKVINRTRSDKWHNMDDWSPMEWACAMAGEAGEVCNAVKKLKRLETGMRQAKGPVSKDEAIQKIAEEIGDVFLYLDLLAQRVGLDTAECIKNTFNRVSIREGFEERIPD